MRSIEAEGSSIDDAIANALSALRVERDRVEVEILANSTRGVFGFGGRRARIRATVREPLSVAMRTVSDVSRETIGPVRASESPVAQPQAPPSGGPVHTSGDAAGRARVLLEQVLSLLGVSCVVEAVADNQPGTITLAVRGVETGLVIGRHGQTLDALEYLLGRMIGRTEESPRRIVLDVDGYHERRQESLEQLALRMAAKVKQTGRIATLNPMSPRDRRIVHLALQSDEAVVTRSQGDGHYRKILILPQARSRRNHSTDDPTR